MRTYFSFKSVFQNEAYLNVVRNRSHQRSLTKLRISSHKLEIESGRYSRKAVAERIRKKCNDDKIEDEIHFICDCSLYNAERLRLFDYVNQEISNFFLSLNSFDKLSRIVRKPDFCLGENKGADQLRGNREADQRLCFRYSDSTIPLLLKSEISSF